MCELHMFVVRWNLHAVAGVVGLVDNTEGHSVGVCRRVSLLSVPLRGHVVLECQSEMQKK
jgi:hypothetical protein